MTLYFFIGEEVAKAERLKSQMITNLEMARDRVTNLCKYIMSDYNQQFQKFNAELELYSLVWYLKH